MLNNQGTAPSPQTQGTALLMTDSNEVGMMYLNVYIQIYIQCKYLY